MRRGPDWYKRDPIAFLDGVQGLGPDLIGCYAVILDLLYARAGSCRRDDRHLAGILGSSIRRASALTDRLIKIGKVEFDGINLTNARASVEAMDRADLSRERAEAGRKGGLSRARNAGNHARTLREPSANLPDDGWMTDANGPGASLDINDLPEASASSNDQAEKTRQDNNPPKPPVGGRDEVHSSEGREAPTPKSSKRGRSGARTEAADAEAESIAILATVASPTLATEFVAHRRAMRKPLSPSGATHLAASLATCDANAALAASIANGWQGVFPERSPKGTEPQARRDVVDAGTFGRLPVSR